MTADDVTATLAGLGSVRDWQEDFYRDLHAHPDSPCEQPVVVLVDLNGSREHLVPEQERSRPGRRGWIERERLRIRSDVSAF